MEKSKRIFSLFLVFFMTFQIIGSLNIKVVKAATASAKLRILEITSDGSSQLDSVKTNKLQYSDVELTTVSMKKFVAMREELDGRYDVVYIGSGKYATTTEGDPIKMVGDGRVDDKDYIKDIMNDITQLKVEEIEAFYTDTNNYFVVHQDLANTGVIDSKSDVYKEYKSFADGSSTKANIIKISNAADFITAFDDTSNRNNIFIHPNLSDVTNINNDVEKEGTKTITFKISNATYLQANGISKVKVDLLYDDFLDARYSKQLSTATIDLVSNEQTHSISYIFSSDESYKHMAIKLRATNVGGNNSKFYETGIFTYKGNKIELRVLQILSQDSKKVPKFEGNGQYKDLYSIDIDYKIVESVDQNTTDTDTREKALFEWYFGNSVTDEQKNLYYQNKIQSYLDHYDMLLIGNNTTEAMDTMFTNLNNDTAKEMYKEYLPKLITAFENNTSKVVIGTKSILSNENNMVAQAVDDNISSYIGANLKITGNGANVGKLVVVNDGILNTKANNLGDNININNYSFINARRLNLEDRDTVVWINLDQWGGDNSYDLYHTFSKGRFIYTSIGKGGEVGQERMLLENIILGAASKIGPPPSPPKQYKRNVLEITQSGVSDIESRINTYNATVVENKKIEVTTLSMKEFVALRQQLEGKYDIIYIGTGTYSTTKPSVISQSSSAIQFQDNHNTAGIDNDITQLKVNEIETFFLGEGYDVILLEDIKNLSASGSKLKIFANNPNNTGITFANDVPNVVTLITTGTTVKRPVFSVSGPSNDLGFSGYEKDSTIEFDIQIQNYNPSATYTLNLYYDDNYNNIFANRNVPTGKLDQDSEKRELQPENITNNGSGSYKISYRLPAERTGIKNWMIEVEETTGTDTKISYVSGFYKFKGYKVNPRVLNVMPSIAGIAAKSGITADTPIQTIATPIARKDDGTDWYGMDYDKLNKAPTEYEIEVDTITATDFKAYCDANTIEDATRELRGRYSMMMFGFKDSYYASADIQGNTKEIIDKYMNPGIPALARSVFFSHDTLNKYMDSPFARAWRYFTNVFAQTGINTEMGRAKLNVNTEKAKQVNTGLINMYPYNLTGKTDKKINIGETHAQYTPLDLENQSVIPWYNNDFDSFERIGNVNDSANHYYTYTVGDYLTMTGAGHNNPYVANSVAVFKEDEKELFINTIYRSALNVNMAPVLLINKGTGGVTGTFGTGGDYEFVNTPTITNENQTEGMEIIDIKVPLLMTNKRFTLHYTTSEYDTNKAVNITAEFYKGKVSYQAGTMNVVIPPNITDRISTKNIGTANADGTYKPLNIEKEDFGSNLEFVIKLTILDGAGAETVKYINVTPNGVELTPNFSINNKDTTEHTIEVTSMYPGPMANVTWNVKYANSYGVMQTKTLAEAAADPNRYLDLLDILDTNENKFKVKFKAPGKVEFIANHGTVTGSCQVVAYMGGYLSPIKAGDASFESVIANVGTMRKTATIAASAITNETTLTNFKIELALDKTNSRSTNLDQYVDVSGLNLKVVKKGGTGTGTDLMGSIAINDITPFGDAVGGNKIVLNAGILSSYFGANIDDDGIYNIVVSANGVTYKSGIDLLEYQNYAVLSKDIDATNAQNKFVDFKVKITCTKTEKVLRPSNVPLATPLYDYVIDSKYIISQGTMTRFNYIAIPKIQ